ncbi:MAG: DNA polymerase III subunit gamma/tau [Bacteroidetes bacterium]|nr:DNA polymerase III subunit gamma/tau [Bacteroidota bacterium]
MENFVVSARKYRPVTFDTVVGQSSITNTLKNAIRNQHLAQAFLFCGPRGVGKTTCARILAKTINCQNLSDKFEACNECESCVSFNKSASFNIHELDAASNNSVDDIRNLVDRVRVPPQVGKYKVYIIDEVHMLSAAAFNAFLKTLEEPPAYAKFILATTEKHKIIPTILSRCQIFDFKRITVDDIAKHLKYVAENEKVNASDDALHIIAQKADGALRDALSIFDQLVSFAGNELTYENVIQNLNVLDYDYYFRIVQHILKGDASGTLLIINEIIDNGFDGQYFIIGLGEHLRNLLVCKDPATAGLLEVSENLRKRYLDQSGLCETAFLLKALSINNQYDVQYKSSNNKRLQLELSLLQMCGLKGFPAKDAAQKIKTPGLPSPDKTPKAPEAPKAAKINKEAEAQKKEVATETKEEAVKEEKEEATSYQAEDDSLLEHISIKKTSKILNGDKEKEEATEEIHQPKEKTPFSESELHTSWAKGIPEISKHSANLQSSLMSRKPVLKDDFLIEVTADNKVIDKEIKKLVPALLKYLRKELNNDFIAITTKLADIKEQQDKAYFPDEIYKKMVEKNPEIKNLRDQLDLEIDF